MTRSGYLFDLVVFLESGRAAVAEGAVLPGAVVPGDVFGDRPSGHGAGRPGLKINQLAVERGKKRSRKGRRPSTERCGPGQCDAIFASERGERGGGALP